MRLWLVEDDTDCDIIRIYHDKSQSFLGTIDKSRLFHLDDFYYEMPTYSDGGKVATLEIEDE